MGANVIYARVTYRPKGSSGLWNYGWVFASPSLKAAQTTLDNYATSPNSTEYHATEVLDCDFDHPDVQKRKWKAHLSGKHRNKPQYACPLCSKREEVLS